MVGEGPRTNDSHPIAPPRLASRATPYALPGTASCHAAPRIQTLPRLLNTDLPSPVTSR